MAEEKETTPVEEKATPPVETKGAEAEEKKTPPEQMPAQAAASEAKRKYKLKVDGAEEEVDEDEVVRRAQMGTAAHQRFAEAARIRKDAEEILGYLRKDKRQALEQICIAEAGGDREKGKQLLRDMAERIVADNLEEQALSPEEKSAREKKKELDAKEAALKRREEEWNQHLTDLQVTEIKEQMLKELPVAIQKAGLPDNQHTRRRILEWIKWAAEQDYDLPVEVAAKEVKKEKLSARKDAISDMKAEELETEYPDLHKAIIKRYTESIRGTSTPPTSTPPKGEAASKGKGRSGHRLYSSFRELHEALEQKQ